MNADDRATPTSGRTFMPVNADAAQQEQPAGEVPTTGTIPQRTALRPGASAQYSTRPVGTAPTTGQPVSGQPVSGQHATGQPASGGPSSEAGGPGAVGAVGGKLKGYATKAKQSLTEGDDVTAARSKGGPRKARVLLSRIDPWSALKMGFLLSIAAGIMLVVAVFILWGVLNQMGIFTLVNDWILKLFTPDQELDLLQFTSLSKVMSATILLSIINVVLLTALTTIGAFLYNIVSSVVGGVYVTLTDD